MSRVLVVTGMHRSGTSLVANYLHRAGVSMGAELLPADVGNPHGYYEDVVIHDLHRDVLRQAGIADGFTVRDSDLPVLVDDALRDRARAYVDSRRGEAQWGWKEPRTSLLCDMWLDILGDATFLFLFREPLAVLDSLLRRAAQEAITDDPTLGLVTWRNYNSEIVRVGHAHPDACVFYETQTFVERPDDLVETLRTGFGFELRPVELKDVLVDDAYHRTIRMRARLLARRNRGETKACLRLYDELRALAARRN